MVADVDNKIKKGLVRAENPIQGNNRAEREQIEQASILQRKLLENPSLSGGITKKENALKQQKAPEMS